MTVIFSIPAGHLGQVSSLLTTTPETYGQSWEQHTHDAVAVLDAALRGIKSVPSHDILLETDTDTASALAELCAAVTADTGCVTLVREAAQNLHGQLNG